MFGRKKKVTDAKSALEASVDNVDSFFTEEFREELRNRGRLHFEKIINENAMFLKQDLDMTTAQLNEYLKKQIESRLNDQFGNYGQAMADAQQLALESLNKNAQLLQEQHSTLTQTLEQNVAKQEAALVKIYEDNMARIIEHYLMESLGDQFDLKAQLPQVIKQMESKKDDIIKDMKL